ncbi:MAG: protein-export chaperone SecB [Rhodothalassiaceae bacterium]
MADKDKDDKQSTAGSDGAATGAEAAAGPAAQTAQDNAPQAAILAQYVKDLSFENPKAAQTLQRLSQPGAKPQIEVNINVGGTRVAEEAFEVELKITATSRIGEETAFAVELVYAGLFGARNLPDNVLEPFLLVQAPTVLFPFARRIIADTVRDGGFAPLMLEPIDFGALYQQQRLQAQQQQQGQGTSASAEIGTLDLGEPKGTA